MFERRGLSNSLWFNLSLDSMQQYLLDLQIEGLVETLNYKIYNIIPYKQVRIFKLNLAWYKCAGDNQVI